MTRGRLRVLLGAAPGVGKTFTMLEEGHRLRASGVDVVVGVLETHGRAATAGLVGDLEIVPRRRIDHRGVPLDEMDLEAVLERAPQLALVDEFAHTNAPGSRHEKRWNDVESLLDAGIDVITTLNVQHIASLTDVVHRITGALQRETVPDAVVRAADQIEVIDLAPQALRDRLSAGVVYPAGRVDAALSNYFRLGNLTALRELALLWLADEVDQALKRYRSEHGIATQWEARERIVVALTGGPEGETLLRRGARIAARSGGAELFAVHVSSPDGLADTNVKALASQRALVEQLGGSYHQLVSERIPTALVDFARSVDATQLVIGVSRRGRIESMVSGQGIGAAVIRAAGEIDVHMVSHAQAGRSRRLPRLGNPLSLRRRIAAYALTVLGLPLMTWGLHEFRTGDTIAVEVLLFQLFVVIVAVMGGIWPAALAATAGALLLDFFFVQPRLTIAVNDPVNVVALVVFLLVAVLVSVVVDQAARRQRAAARSAAEAETLVAVAGSVLGGADALEALVAQLREAFGLTSVLLRDGDGIVAKALDAAAISDDDVETTIPLGEQAGLYLRGRALDGSERRVLGAFVSQLETALVQRRLTAEADEARPLAAADRLRTALLAAVGHDLRRPLAAATAAVGALRADGSGLSAADERDLLDTADTSLTALSRLVTDLLDVSRLQAGVLGVHEGAVTVDDVVLHALDELGLSPGDVELDLAPVPAVSGDGALLQRTLTNLLTNALRFAPAGTAPIIASSEFAGRVQIRVIDHGPGIPAAQRDEVFVPFQRLGDVDNATGLGLGLAIAKGFVEAMGGTLEAEDTPGGGLTMVVDLAALGGDAQTPDAEGPDAGATAHPDPTPPTAQPAPDTTATQEVRR